MVEPACEPANETRPAHVGPVRYAALETLYAVTAGTTYASGASEAICNVLAKPLPRIRRNRKEVEKTQRRLPVLLLHGLAHNQSWSFKIQKELHRAGFVTRSENYQTFGHCINSCADRVAERIWEFAGRNAAPAVHVAAHSIGGLVLRAAINRNPEIRDYVATGVTLGSPHNGTPWAYIPAWFIPRVNKIIDELRPGSHTLSELDEQTVAGTTRWVSVFSTTDEIVPSYYGRLDHPLLNAQTVELSGIGHYGLSYHPLAIDAVVSSTIASDTAFAAAWDAEYSAA